MSTSSVRGPTAGQLLCTKVRSVPHFPFAGFCILFIDTSVPFVLAIYLERAFIGFVFSAVALFFVYPLFSDLAIPSQGVC